MRRPRLHLRAPRDRPPVADRLAPAEPHRAALKRLRERIRRAHVDGGAPSDEEQRLARQMRALREEIAAQMGVVQACARCAEIRGHPADPWPLGDCCTGAPGIVFDETELASLRASGTRPRHLRWGRTAGRGCPHCGPRGCRLPPRHRANRCLWYLCPELSRELHALGRLATVEQSCEQLAGLFQRYGALRRQRLEETFCADLERRLR
jgi:hypothetical protein